MIKNTNEFDKNFNELAPGPLQSQSCNVSPPICPHNSPPQIIKMPISELITTLYIIICIIFVGSSFNIAIIFTFTSIKELGSSHTLKYSQLKFTTNHCTLKVQKWQFWKVKVMVIVKVIQQCSAGKLSTVQCRAVHCTALHCIAIQCCAVQGSAVKCSAVVFMAFMILWLLILPLN